MHGSHAEQPLKALRRAGAEKPEPMCSPPSGHQVSGSETPVGSAQPLQATSPSWVFGIRRSWPSVPTLPHPPWTSDLPLLASVSTFIEWANGAPLPSKKMWQYHVCGHCRGRGWEDVERSQGMSQGLGKSVLGILGLLRSKLLS